MVTRLDLDDGITTIKIEVVFQDNGADHTYTIRVSRADLPGAPAITGPITSGTGSLTVSWAAPGDTGTAEITSYDLRYIESASSDNADVNWTVVEGAWTTGSLSHTIEGLTGGEGGQQCGSRPLVRNFQRGAADDARHTCHRLADSRRRNAHR